jgi:hypothetical protein
MHTANFIVTVLATASLSIPALAQTSPDPNATPGIDKRLENQDKRIQKGVETGQLTPREAARMEKRQDKIQSDVDKAKADGVVTAQERRQLHRELDRSSGAIYREKHDRQHDYNHDGKVDRPRKK